jgi:cytochrome c oxidase assembly factor CtaG
LALALMSPLHWLGERLFAAHMVEHCILIAVAAPLIVIARPTAAMLWAVPKPAAAHFVATGALLAGRACVGQTQRCGDIDGGARRGAVGLAHACTLSLTLVSIGWHRVEHVSFTLTAMLFWWSLARGGERGVKLACLFVTTLHMGLLGLLLTLSPHLWYPAQSALAVDWGLTPLQDQQLAGLLMWVPMGAVYTIAALWVASRWISGGVAAGRASRRGHFLPLARSIWRLAVFRAVGVVRPRDEPAHGRALHQDCEDNDGVAHE